MILDLIVVGILLIATVRGKVCGFLETVIRFLALIGALVLGVMFTPQTAQLLYATRIDEHLMDRLNAIAEDGIIDFANYIPEVLSNTFGAIEDISLRVTVLHFTNVAITIFAFMLIVIGVWIIATLLIKKIRKSKREKGVIGSVDSSVGLLIGAIKGIILVFLFLAFLFPLAGIFMPEQIQTINEQLNNSFVAGMLYDINPLLIFMKKLAL
ncbi:MAG: CvpA family protein [Clostridiales bacterium]|nr:CvpA family protein [Candidatus Crickella merdequi]